MVRDLGPRRFVGDQSRVAGDFGYVLAMTALLLLPILVATAFATDLGAWYAQAARMQRAADAAALAGVVWASDPVKWDTEARATATQNGYTDGVNGVTVSVSRISSQRIQVRIQSSATQYFSKLVYSGQTLSRKATAEYVFPVPLGSPTNSLGTGTMSPTTGRTNLWLSVNGFCTRKAAGDQFLSFYSNPDTNGCTGKAPSGRNPDFTRSGYTFYVDLPTTRTYSTRVLAFDPQLNTNSGTPDLVYGGADFSTQYTMFDADATPLDDLDNPVTNAATYCQNDNPAVFARNNATNGVHSTVSQFGRTWTVLCTIPPSYNPGGTGAPSQRFMMRVTTTPNASTCPTTPTTTACNNQVSENNFALSAQTTGSGAFGGDGSCSSIASSTCPRVYARDSLSVFTAEGSGTGTFWLAEVDPIHAGKRMVMKVYDPDENATGIELLAPTGAGTWAPANFDWTSDNATYPGGTNASSVSLGAAGGNRFNGNTITLSYDLTGYTAAGGSNAWFKVRYTFGGSSGTDHTTWTVNIVGNPVHLTE